MNQEKETKKYGWLTERVVSNPVRYFDLLLADINNAEVSIDLGVYIFSVDGVGRRILDALIDGSRRGVKVRVLIDGVGSSASAAYIARQLSKVGADVRIYHPIPWYVSNYRWSLHQGLFLDKFFHFLSRLNNRDHRKFCIVDNSIAWCGNFNICDDHLRADSPWRDYAARLTGASVQSLTDNFTGVWFKEIQKFTLGSLQYFRTNTSLRLRWLRDRQLSSRIRHTKQRIVICSAYFSPSGSMLRAIKFARKKGVDITLIVAGRSDVPLFSSLISSYYYQLLKVGVTIYRYNAGVLHAKVLLVDERCVIGSTNMNHRSFYHDLELDVVLSDIASIKNIRECLNEDISKSTKVTEKDLSDFTFSVMLGWLVRAFRYWM